MSRQRNQALNKSLVQEQFGAHAAAYATSAVHAKGASLGRLVELVRPQATWHVPTKRSRRYATPAKDAAKDSRI
jgi:hypothetical protein